MHGGLREEGSQGGQGKKQNEKEVAEEGEDGQQQQPKKVFGGFASTRSMRTRASCHESSYNPQIMS